MMLPLIVCAKYTVNYAHSCKEQSTLDSMQSPTSNPLAQHGLVDSKMTLLTTRPIHTYLYNTCYGILSACLKESIPVYYNGFTTHGFNCNAKGMCAHAHTCISCAKVWNVTTTTQSPVHCNDSCQIEYQQISCTVFLYKLLVACARYRMACMPPTYSTILPKIVSCTYITEHR